MKTEFFEEAIEVVFKHEGFYSNDKDDPGGATQYGISLRFLKNEGLDLNFDGEIDLEDVRSLSVEDAKKLYKKYFWSAYHYNKILSKYTAIKLLDLSVNIGHFQAHKLIQRAINELSESLKLDIALKVDGIFGKRTLNSLNLMLELKKEPELKLNMIFNQVKFYIAIIEKNNALKKFLRGWILRAIY